MYTYWACVCINMLDDLTVVIVDKIADFVAKIGKHIFTIMLN